MACGCQGAKPGVSLNPVITNPAFDNATAKQRWKVGDQYFEDIYDARVLAHATSQIIEQKIVYIENGTGIVLG